MDQRTYEVSKQVSDDLVKRFTYHKPDDEQPGRYAALRGNGMDLAHTICALCPESRERALAITKLEEAIFWANAAIARNESAQAAAAV